MGKKIVILGIVGLFLWSCHKDEPFDDKKMIRNMYEQIIKPEEAKLYNDAIALQGLTNEFVANTTIENIQKIRNQWFTVAKDWARCYTFDIGRVKKGRFLEYLAGFPINNSGIENKIEKLTLEEITPKYVLEKFGVDMKGLFGLEYLLYKDSAEQTVATFSKSEKRRKVLQLITNEFINDINDRKVAWEEYAPKFITNDDDIQSMDNSFNQLMNGLNNVIHYAWETKIEKGIRKKEFEARYSKKSLDLIRENVAMTKKVYFSGIDKKVKATVKYEGLNKVVKERYEKIEKAINAIQIPLSEAVKTERGKVDTLLKELKLLQQKEFLTDLRRALSFLELSTDGDGD